MEQVIKKRKVSRHVSDKLMKVKAEEVILGEKTQAQAARELDVSRQNFGERMKRADIREHLLRVANDNAINIVPVAMENVRNSVNRLNNGKKLTDKEMDLGWKATESSLKMGGLLSTGGDSYHLTQIYHDQKILISPAIQTLLEEHAKKFMFSEAEVVQIEGREDKG